jgi:transketolase
MTYEEKLLELAESDERVVVMTAENRAAIRGLPAKLGDRFIDVGIAEQTLIGAAAGLALRGRRPVVHALAAFLTLRAYEFIRTDVGIAGLPVKLVGGVPGFLSDGNGPTHQAIEDIAILRQVPGMRVICPADEAELVEALPAIVADPQPCYVRHVGLPPTVQHRQPFEIGRAEVLSEGGDVTIVSYGFLLREAELARRLLEAIGLSVRLVNLRTVWPVDEALLLRCARESRLLVTVEDHFAVGGLATICAELFVRSGLRPRLLHLDLGRHWFVPGLLPDVLEAEGFTGAQIARRIATALEEDK